MTDDALPPQLYVLFSIASVQLGAALATQLFASLGPGGAALLRVGFAAIALLLVWRPRVLGGRYTWREYLLAALFGLALAGMNYTFYLALARIPLGIAVTIEFVGPLGVALAGSRRALDFLWAALAGVGILLLAPLNLLQFAGAAHGGVALDLLGVVFALVAGGFWAAYILLNARVGRAFPGGGGLALAMAVGGLALLPIGILDAGRALLDPRLLLIGLGVALLSSIVPFSLELEALRRLPTQVFGVLLSLDPAIAALVGALILHETLDLRAILAIACVTLAALGSSRFRKHVVQ